MLQFFVSLSVLVIFLTAYVHVLSSVSLIVSELGKNDWKCLITKLILCPASLKTNLDRRSPFYFTIFILHFNYYVYHFPHLGYVNDNRPSKCKHDETVWFSEERPSQLKKIMHSL